MLCERCLSEPCPPCPDTNFNPALIGWYLTWQGAFSGQATTIGTDNLALGVLYGIITQLIIIGLPISYLISCSIAYFYKSKKKSK
jgi:hypothetical protein